MYAQAYTPALMSDHVNITRRGAILEVTLDRPKANAIDAPTSRALGEAFENFRDDPDLRVAIFTGGGDKFFSAGWDLHAAAQGEEYESDYGPGGFGGFPELPNLNKPVIAAVNGMAVGGGFELAMSADLVVAVDHSSFFLPEASVGIIPDAATVRLPKLIPRAVAAEILIAGGRLGADEALHFGLVNKVVPAHELMDSARTLATKIIALAPLAVEAILDLRRRTAAMTITEGLAHMRSGEVESYQRMLGSEDAREGPRAFSEKRHPEWKGR